MMIKYLQIILFLSSFLFLSHNVKAQKRATVYAEAYGNGYALSIINIDYRIGENDKGLGVRAGYAFGETCDFLGMVNYLIGPKNHKIELGLGVLNFASRDELALISSDISEGIKPTANISYRYNANNGFMFKVGWTPFIIDKNEKLLTWGGIGIGWKIF